MITYVIAYVDIYSNGKVRSTTYTTSEPVSECFLVKFFGLDQPDVIWWKIDIDELDH